MANKLRIGCALAIFTGILLSQALAQTKPTPHAETSGAPGDLMELPAASSGAPSGPTPVLPPLQLQPLNAPPVAAAPPAATPGAVAAPVNSASPVIPPAPATAAPAPAPATTTAPSPKEIADIVEKNPDLVLDPLQAGSMSLMFSKTDMDVLAPFIKIYDNTTLSRNSSASASNPDDLNALLMSLKHDDPQQKAAAGPKPLPNLYLSSIVYYSPSNWSVWINGRKLINANNLPQGEFYVNRLSRAEVELIWKPPVMSDIAALWDQVTDKGKNPLPTVSVNASKGTVMLRMHPNQTFLPRSLAIREGYIRANLGMVSHVTPPGPSGHAGFNSTPFPNFSHDFHATP